VVEDNSDGGTMRSDSARSSAPRKLFDEDALLERVSGDHKLMAEVIRLFLDELPMRLHAIQIAVAAENAEALRVSAHALRGAAGNLSVDGLVEAARILERLGADAHMNAAGAAWTTLSVEAGNVTDILRRHAAAA
jgi:HPt (histidine-containing phosphotransfer) domain-containing protein